VLKLKEYGRYVIGVGIRESSSDLLVQNCDEYYSYNALAGLVKSSEEEVVKWDPWELVVESIGRMQRNGDVMRADRLKQVMQDIDPNFDEGNLGMAKFSRFCQEAAQRGLLRVSKLENGQLEVAPAEGAAVAAKAAAKPAAKPAASTSTTTRATSRACIGPTGRQSATSCCFKSPPWRPRWIEEVPPKVGWRAVSRQGLCRDRGDGRRS
jgi:hypothetical protein